MGGLYPGSSPLTRGKQIGEVGGGFDGGLIPAHAGKTPRRAGQAWRAGAHPRSRGENNRGPTGDLSPLGSSPLTRGKQGEDLDHAASSGLIPAHAGKTRSTASSTRSPPAHPRSRGENRCACLGVRVVPGSSPLTRGKRELFGADAERRGLIPAHAGKTVEGGAHEVRLPAHPRSRGENGATMDKIVALVGSSPLTRGKREGHGRAVSLPGLIPAHAGKTITSRGYAPPRRAHPRSRGENGARPHVTRAEEGSSPLTRGKRPGAGP